MAEITGTPPVERDGYSYPLLKTNLRPIPDTYSGDVILSDIDNTYLHTVYKSIGDFVRLAIEGAQDKKPIYGAPALFRGLRQGPQSLSDSDKSSDESEYPNHRTPMFFVSASPESMRRKLERRFLLDEVDFDGCSFRNLWRDRTPNIRHIKEIFGYKIAALLSYRLEQPGEYRQILFGDDLEHDREIYVLYSRICAGKIRGDDLDKILIHRGVMDRDRDYIIKIANELPEFDGVDKIYIRRVPHKTGQSSAAVFDASDERVVMTNNYFETAVWLFVDGKLSWQALVDVAKEIFEAKPSLDWFDSSVIHLKTNEKQSISDKVSDDMLKELRRRLEEFGIELKNIVNEIVSEAKIEPIQAGTVPKKEENKMTEETSSTETEATKAPATDEQAEVQVVYKDEIEFDDFMKMDLRVATVKTCEIVKGADRLLKMELDVSGDTRTVVSGIRAFYEAEDMVGRQVIYLANLKPRKLRGIMSQGMVLAATDDNKAKLLKVDSECQSGASVS